MPNKISKNHPPILFITRPEVFDNASGVIEELPPTAKLDETFLLYAQNKETMEGTGGSNVGGGNVGGGTTTPVNTVEAGRNKTEFTVSQWVMVSQTIYRLSIPNAPADADVYMTDAAGVSILVGVGTTYQGTTLLLESNHPFKGYIAY